MDRIEMVEKLREKTGVTYEEAKAALETSEWDLLDAVVLLEKAGKVKDAAYSTKRTASEEEQGSEQKAKKQKEKNDGFEKFMNFVGRIIHKGNTNSLVILRGGEKKFSLPVTAFVLLLVLLPYITIPLLIVSLFFSFHYRFTGPDLGKEKINNAMERASKAAEAVKEEFKEESREERKEDLKRAKEEIKQELKDLAEEFEEALEELEEELEELEAELEEKDEE